MGSKTISVTEDVYMFLSSMKLKGESFSDMFMRLTKKRGAIAECAGLWGDMSEEEVREIKEGIEEMRKSFGLSLREKAEV